MLVIIWKYEVHEERKSEFERVYGPSCEWAQLFARADGFLGTELLCDTDADGTYITIDRWVSEESFEHFHRRWAREYAQLDQRCEALTTRELRLGSYVQLSSKHVDAE